jgi:hypothetical protein
VIRRVIPGLLVLALAVAGLAAQDRPVADQDEPPVRLKKKDRPKAEEPKDDAAKPDNKEPPKPAVEEKKPKPEERLKKGDEPPDVPQEPEVNEEEVLNRALKNARTAADLLQKQKADEPTQQVQRDVLKDLDSLIEQEKRAQQDQGGQQDQDQANAGQQPKDGQDGGMGKQQAGKPQPGAGQPGQQKKGSIFGRKRGQSQQQTAQGTGRGGRRRQARGNRPGQQGDQQMAQGDQPQGGGGKANQGGNGGTSPTEQNKLADVYKDVWGHLPEALRGEMNAYSREQFMDKYKEVLKQYYATIAEKGRRKN